MSLTPEQEAREREAFDKWFRDHYDIPLIRNSRAEAAYLARAEIAAAEREQRDKLHSFAKELLLTLATGFPTHAGYPGRCVNVSCVWINMRQEELDAILASREQKGEG